MNVDSLPVGFRLDDPIYDEHGILLLDRGIELTEAFLEGLRARGVTQVCVGEEETFRHRRRQSTRSRIPATKPAAVMEQVKHRLSQLQRQSRAIQPSQGSYAPEMSTRVAGHLDEAVDAINDVVAELQTGSPLHLDNVEFATAQNLLDLAEDVDLAIHSAVGANPDDVSYNLKLSRISLKCSVLSLAVGIRLQLPPADLLHLGMAAIMADLSLFRSPSQFDSEFDDEEPIQFTEHPEASYEQLKSLRTVPGPVLKAILQHHELLDGTGYPRGLIGDEICQTARIVGLVQAYLALASPIEGAQSFYPSDCVAYLMHQTLLGRFDKQVSTAFVHTVSVYPIGSYVRLSDDRIAEVRRAADRDAMRPLVCVDGEMCNLESDSSLAIVSPVIEESESRRRLTSDLLDSILW